jgi:hypothetical protein
VVEGESAASHRALFHHINSVVYEDTGEYLLWRHIHFDFPDPAPGVMFKTMVIADFHRGQALGMSLFFDHGYF